MRRTGHSRRKAPELVHPDVIGMHDIDGVGLQQALERPHGFREHRNLAAKAAHRGKGQIGQRDPFLTKRVEILSQSSVLLMQAYDRGPRRVGQCPDQRQGRHVAAADGIAHIGKENSAARAPLGAHAESPARVGRS